ncbi:phage tail sheath subtilisin-like domain-containing protein [Roseomonas aerophila]|uniref:Phage tail sheath subtilisin-like domain-containing protein n=1 Tax=Teichococcus aerophilus TaxID=1224513 RepID=A0ABR7RQS9_9PROT|nr:phage tail sheath subtilisin-like domain-containing protein [Pseudoroseomonas aerophila]MBC9208937.1 phage tail sheath subtilisin-like domain-containing protein [Pseudoroseomonas aerophila]
MVDFAQIPQNLRLPLFYAELDNSRANSGQQNQRTLIIGQQAAGGALVAGKAVLLQGIAWVQAQAGLGSQLALMAEWYRKRDSFGEVYLLPLADAAAAVAATATIAVTTAATAPGTLNLYIGGQRVQVLVSAAQTTAQTATAIAAAINAMASLPVTATVTTSTVTLTAKNKGACGNDIDLQLNFLGAAGGEATPSGLVLAISAMTGGTANPTLDTALAALGDKEFDFIVLPYTDTASLDAMKAFLAARWSWERMLYGGAFAALRGTLGAATTFGLARNDAHVSVMPFNGSPTPAVLWAANTAGAYAQSLRADPGLPLHGLPLDVLAPPIESRFAAAERNVLLWDGLSTFAVADDGTVTTETIVTTYQKNALGQPDDSYLYVERLYTIAYVIRDLKQFITSRFGRVKLASDGTTPRAGSRTVTPGVIRDAILGRYRFLERNGYVQEYEQFAASLVVERNGTNRCRVDAHLPIIPIDQLRQLAAVVQPRNAGEE